jgi:hypothetical protein
MFVKDSWYEEGYICTLKWNPLLRRAEVWRLVDVSQYKELGVAYNNGLCSLAQAVQVRDHYKNYMYLPMETMHW